jgi:hypothetical protein
MHRVNVDLLYRIRHEFVKTVSPPSDSGADRQSGNPSALIATGAAGRGTTEILRGAPRTPSFATRGGLASIEIPYTERIAILTVPDAETPPDIVSV